jgi:hypothetical protein
MTINLLTGSSPTITSAMIASLNAAITVANNTIGTGSLDNLSIAQLQLITSAFQDAYNTFAAGISVPQNIDLDAVGGVGVSDGTVAITPTAASTIDAWNNFVVQVNDVTSESDLNIALAYISRIIQNLTRSPG